MALTETKVIDKIEIVQDGTLQVREATRILRDDNEIAKTYRLLLKRLGLLKSLQLIKHKWPHKLKALALNV